MSIPLDRLYHYIEDVAQEVYNDDVIIYRFFPHGSKKLKDLNPVRSVYANWYTTPPIICHDQEPLCWDDYKNEPGFPGPGVQNLCEKYNVKFDSQNLNNRLTTVYDRAVLLHSEVNSQQVQYYSQHGFIPAYYWAHGIIAQDWFRFAQHVNFNKAPNRRRFLIYNRAWSGTREYRLKFVESLVQSNLLSHCRVTFNPVDPETQTHYQDHQYRNHDWKPQLLLENYFATTSAPSSSSADFDINDYKISDFEVVLETLFDTNTIQLTEKSLRPIACGQPFILMAPPGSLKYLRNYGFQTFNNVIDESYDQIQHPAQRLQAVTAEMTRISNWTDSELLNNLSKIQSRIDHNRERFFSKDFHHQIEQELKKNLVQALTELNATNTGTRFIEFRKTLAQYNEIRTHLLVSRSATERQLIKQALLKIKRHQSQHSNQ